jgi:hypothetical protein
LSRGHRRRQTKPQTKITVLVQIPALSQP